MSPKDDHAKVVVNPFLIYIGLGLAALLLQRVLPLPFLAQPAARLLGLLLLLLNLLIGLPAAIGMVAARTSLNPARPTTSLVLSGPYRRTRNPMYVGMTLIYTGLMIIFRLPWGLLLLPLVIWLITTWVIVPEEQYLEKKFGAEYATYKSSVARWL
jgi:protein-S-isoprenylcysteine O-methyltransferase Ste14